MLIRICVALLASALLGPSAASGQQAAKPIDWAALTTETVNVLSEYIRVNTTNPPGKELDGARFLERILRREGIEARILDTMELGQGRANLYARLKGNGSKKAIALVHHIDVVPATASAWTVDPYAGIVKDGYIWGRGAIDMKSEGIVHLMAMIAIKRSGIPLTRDIVFIGNADEELGSTGAVVFVDKHRDLLADVEYLMTEGGGNQVDNGKLAYYGVGVSEKRTFWQRLSVKGTPSHGSRPTKLNPVPRLVAALDKIAKYETPLHVTEGVDKYFRDISRGFPEPRRGWLANVKKSLENPKAREWILSDVYWNAILRNTISLTALQGSNKTNVIPAEATAEIDIRLLPDTDPAAFMATLERIVNDTAVHFSPLLSPKPPLENPIRTDLFRAIERASRERDPDALVTTPMLTAATDRPTYRRLGIITYGFDPFKIEASLRQTGMHGNDERISIDDISFGLRYTYDVLRYVQ
jgi:acetylornithine deacetylase/succinyl-diaminopimelate desuccinylase-like protein